MGIAWRVNIGKRKLSLLVRFENIHQMDIEKIAVPSQKMQKMVGFRNIAVHYYQAIDPNILKSIISHHLKDLEDFYSCVIGKLKKD